MNVGACINVAQVVAEGMEKSDIAGSIVNISSLVSFSASVSLFFAFNMSFLKIL